MKKRDFILFLLANAFLGVSQSIDTSVFNNFLNDTFHLTISQRTLIEIPREFPGVMVVIVSGALIAFGDIRIAAIANAVAAFGLLGIGFFSNNYLTMILWLTVYSMGTHLFMPVQNTIGMNLSDERNMGKRLGLINGFNTAAFLITSLVTAFIFKYFKVDYKATFIVGAIAFVFSAALIFMMKSTKPEKVQNKLFFRMEYKLFYYLSIVHGARKQIFLTFGPWVLIKIFNQGVSTFAILGFIIAGIGIFFKPILGHLIDTKGEKMVLKFEAIVLFIICIGYAFSESIFKKLGACDTAVIFVAGCYVLDQLFVAAGMARATYLKKISLCPEDVSPTLSMGLSIDHVVSMFVPWIGGFIWNLFGYEFVFLGGAAIAIIIMLLTSKIKLEERVTTSEPSLKL